MFATQREETIADVIQQHEEVFQEGLGRIKGAQATLHINSEVELKFYKPRSLPHALCSKVEDELNRLETDGVNVPVQHSDWATPIVPVLKPDGSVRICGDFKLTANVATKLEIYPLPRIDDLFSSFAGGQHFSKLDLSHAYLQLLLAEESQPIVTVNTHKGLYRYQRLPFGVSTAPRFSNEPWKPSYKVSQTYACTWMTSWSLVHHQHTFEEPGGGFDPPRRCWNEA